MTTRRPILALAPIAALAIALSGCSDDKERPESGPQPTATDSSDAPTVTEPTDEATVTESSDAPTVEDTSDGADSSASPSDLPPVEISEAATPLEAFIDLERTAIPQILEQSGGMYSDVAIDAIDDGTNSGVEYSYTYAEEAPEGTVIIDEAAAQQIQDAAEQSVFPIMEQVGVEGPLVSRWVYLNPDGSEIQSVVALRDEAGTTCMPDPAQYPTLPESCEGL